jgi:hypothetical protein
MAGNVKAESAQSGEIEKCGAACSVFPAPTSMPDAHRTRRERRNALNAKTAIISEYRTANTITHGVGRYFHSRQAASPPYKANSAKKVPVVSWKIWRTTRHRLRKKIFAECQKVGTICPFTP